MNSIAELRRQDSEDNAFASIPSIELEEALDNFVNNLRRDGYRVSTEALTAASGIFLDEIARSPQDLSRLKHRLTPLFATTEAGQRDISSRIDRFVGFHDAKSVGPDPVAEPKQGFYFLAPLLLLAALIAVLLYIGPRGIPSLQDPPIPPNEVRIDERVAPPLNQSAQEYPEIPLQPGVRDLPTSEVVLRETRRLTQARILIAGAVILPLAAAFFWWFIRLARRRHFMRLAHYDYEMPRYLARKYTDAEIPISNDVARTATHLNTSLVGGSGEVDVPRTIAATARSAGFFTPVEADLGTFADYIVLVQRLGPNDHLSRISDIVLDRIERSGVKIRRYYYERDPRQCLPSPDAKDPIPFEQLAKSFGRHRFLVIGAAEGFFHPRTGKLLPWKDAEHIFTSRTLLAARRPEHWTYHEQELARQGFFVSSASPSGMATYGAALGAGREAMPGLRRPALYGAEVQAGALPDGSVDRPPDRTLRTRLQYLWDAGTLRTRLRRSGTLLAAVPRDAIRVWRNVLELSGNAAVPALIAVFAVASIGAAVIWWNGLGVEQPIATVNDTERPDTQTQDVVANLPNLESFRECAVCPEMILLPAGTFLMGSPEDEEGRVGAEGPQRAVSITRFAMASTETTFDDWAACVADGGCTSNPAPEDENWGRGGRPVINVSWADTQEYIAWLNSKVDGAPYRLPTEAEWEYAARAGTTTSFAFGETISTDQANYDGTVVYGAGTVGDYRARTVPVSELEAANDWGLRHMHGNVFEWVEDCWHDDYSGAPTDGSAWLSEQNGDCSVRVLRGGSWFNYPRLLRSAVRSRFVPGNRDVNIGFRPARTLFTP